MQVCWLEQTVEEVPGDDTWLGAREIQTLNKLHVPKRRADWRLGRWTAKLGLCGYLNIAPAREIARVQILAAESGAPQGYIGDNPAKAAISLSHRDGRAICAVAPADAALGCDLEKIEPRSEVFVADYFTANEQSLIARASSIERTKLVAAMWSAKESVLKALRVGL